MNKTTLKNFAINARLELLARVKDRATLYGITEEKVKAHELARSEQFQKLGGDMLTQREIAQRNALISRVSARGFNQAMEEAAYTWFNRFIALRYMQAHNLLPVDVPVLPMAAGELPQIVRQAQNVALEGVDIAVVADMLDNNRTEELYKYLLIALCNALSEPLPQMFEAIEDYTELLFPDGILKAESVLGMLAGVEADNWQDIQVIGWLYQYYNTELKQETFDLLKKNVKITKDRIGAATQLFTPEWIVNYMVENSLGRLWLEGHPDRNLRMKWRYYMDEAEQTPEVAAQLQALRKGYADRQPETITVLDPCMGSGHILVYAFDVLMDIYRSRGYTDRDAVQSIVTNNLYGLDIDDRAAQLAYFAVMMKACEYDRRFLRRGIQPQVCAIQESPRIDMKLLDAFGPDAALAKKLYAAFIDAKEYGSILHVDLTEDELRRLSHGVIAMSAATTGESIANIGDSKHAAGIIAPLVKQAVIMTRKYDVVVTNPPYMGASGMGEKLSKFVKDNYPDSKSDLFAVFIEKCGEYLKATGYQAMITQHAWMFLSSFEKLRGKLQQHELINMAHLGARAFEEIGGEVVQTTAFVLQNRHIDGYAGSYARLIEPTTQQGKEDMFLAEENRYTAQQENFTKIPGMPVAYWVTNSVISTFSEKVLSSYADTRRGLQTGDSSRFIRLWHEVSIDKMSFSWSKDARYNGRKWYALNSGGAFRKWYGNIVNVVDWEYDGKAIKDTGKAIIPSEDRYFDDVISWNKISSGQISVRYQKAGIIPGDASPYLHSTENNLSLLKYAMAILNCKISAVFVQFISPTLNYEVGNIAKIPTIIKETERITNIVDQCIDYSRHDWDSFETSWDFKHHPLI